MGGGATELCLKEEDASTRLPRTFAAIWSFSAALRKLWLPVGVLAGWPLPVPRRSSSSMPLTLEELEDIQADCLADDVDIVFEKMSLWDETTVREYFENGGQLPGVDTQPPGAAGPMLPPVSEAELKRWFPKWKKVEAPRFRIICFHNAGSSESVWTGRGLRTTVDNPFVLHCRERGGELLALELPGREGRRAERRETELQRSAAKKRTPNPKTEPEPGLEP